MDSFPNLYVDLSARAYEIGREPCTAAKFIERYQDRILFGTDQAPGKEMYMAWWRILKLRMSISPGRTGGVSTASSFRTGC